MKLLFSIILAITLTTSASAQAIKQPTTAAEASKLYLKMTGATAKPADSQGYINAIMKYADNVQNDHRVAWNENGHFYEFSLKSKLVERIIRVYTTGPERQLVHLDIVRKNYNVTVGGKDGSGVKAEYQLISSDPNGQIRRGSFAPSLKEIDDITPTFDLQNRGTEIESWWQVQLETEARAVVALIAAIPVK